MHRREGLLEGDLTTGECRGIKIIWSRIERFDPENLVS